MEDNKDDKELSLGRNLAIGGEALANNLLLGVPEIIANKVFKNKSWYKKFKQDKEKTHFDEVGGAIGDVGSFLIPGLGAGKVASLGGRVASKALPNIIGKDLSKIAIKAGSKISNNTLGKGALRAVGGDSARLAALALTGQGDELKNELKSDIILGGAFGGAGKLLKHIPNNKQMADKLNQLRDSSIFRTLNIGRAELNPLMKKFGVKHDEINNYVNSVLDKHRKIDNDLSVANNKLLESTSKAYDEVLNKKVDVEDIKGILKKALGKPTELANTDEARVFNRAMNRINPNSDLKQLKSIASDLKSNQTSDISRELGKKIDDEIDKIAENKIKGLNADYKDAKFIKSILEKEAGGQGKQQTGLRYLFNAASAGAAVANPVVGIGSLLSNKLLTQNMKKFDNFLMSEKGKDIIKKVESGKGLDKLQSIAQNSNKQNTDKLTRIINNKTIKENKDKEDLEQYKRESPESSPANFDNPMTNELKKSLDAYYEKDLAQAKKVGYDLSEYPSKEELYKMVEKRGYFNNPSKLLKKFGYDNDTIKNLKKNSQVVTFIDDFKKNQVNKVLELYSTMNTPWERLKGKIPFSKWKREQEAAKQELTNILVGGGKELGDPNAKGVIQEQERKYIMAGILPTEKNMSLAEAREHILKSLEQKRNLIMKGGVSFS